MEAGKLFKYLHMWVMEFWEHSHIIKCDLGKFFPKIGKLLYE